MFFDSRSVYAVYSSSGFFLIAGLFFAIYPSGGFFDSRGVLCYISKWRFFLIAGVFSAIYPSGVFLIAGLFFAIIIIIIIDIHTRQGAIHEKEEREKEDSREAAIRVAAFLIVGVFSARDQEIFGSSTSGTREDVLR